MKSRRFFAYTPPEFRLFSSAQQAVFGFELQYAQDALVDALLAYLSGTNRVQDAVEGRGVIVRHEDYIRSGLDRKHGAIGETCVAALLLGYVYLVCRRVIKWYVPAAFVGSVFVLYLIFTGDITMAAYEMMAGGLFIGAIFMATDYVTTPITSKGKVVFALGCGVITFIIRYFCSYPEGVSFSILIMNILTPFIEKLTANKPLGGSKNGK